LTEAAGKTGGYIKFLHSGTDLQGMPFVVDVAKLSMIRVKLVQPGHDHHHMVVPLRKSPPLWGRSSKKFNLSFVDGVFVPQVDP